MKIISGGQTGVDQAALRAAKRVGLETGGWMPVGWRTHHGPRPDFAKMYGMKEDAGLYATNSYASRTVANVRDSDASIAIAFDFTSPGEILTLKSTANWGRPLLKIHAFDDCGNMEDVNVVAEWILNVTQVKSEHFILPPRKTVINVAGNSERTWPGIGAIAEQYLVEVFTIVVRLIESNGN